MKFFRAPKAVAPLCVWGGGGLCGDNFIERFALFLESRHFLPSVNQQVAIKDELGLVANRAVTWDKDHRVRDFCHVLLGRANHAVDAAASRIINKRIVTVSERVTDVENIGVCKVNGDVAVGVGGA